MPQSEAVVNDAGGNLGSSGLVLGSYGIGVLVSIPFFMQLQDAWKTGFLGGAIVGLIGNVLYMFGASELSGASSLPVLFLARFVCGLEGGMVAHIVPIIFANTTGSRLRRDSALI